MAGAPDTPLPKVVFLQCCLLSLTLIGPMYVTLLTLTLDAPMLL